MVFFNFKSQHTDEALFSANIQSQSEFVHPVPEDWRYADPATCRILRLPVDATERPGLGRRRSRRLPATCRIWRSAARTATSANVGPDQRSMIAARHLV